MDAQAGGRRRRGPAAATPPPPPLYRRQEGPPAATTRCRHRGEHRHRIGHHVCGEWRRGKGGGGGGRDGRGGRAGSAVARRGGARKEKGTAPPRRSATMALRSARGWGAAPREGRGGAAPANAVGGPAATGGSAGGGSGAGRGPRTGPRRAVTNGRSPPPSATVRRGAPISENCGRNAVVVQIYTPLGVWWTPLVRLSVRFDRWIALMLFSFVTGSTLTDGRCPTAQCWLKLDPRQSLFKA